MGSIRPNVEILTVLYGILVPFHTQSGNIIHPILLSVLLKYFNQPLIARPSGPPL